jgi:hypothetical protein
MRTSLIRLVSRVLVVCLIGLPFQANAGMIGTEQAVDATPAHAARAALLAQIGRAEVAAQLQSLGISAQSAGERVAALTDAEVATLAARIDGLPAGAASQALLVAVVLGLLLWWIYKN